MAKRTFVKINGKKTRLFRAIGGPLNGQMITDEIAENYVQYNASAGTHDCERAVLIFRPRVETK